MKQALLIIDVQNDYFTDGKMPLVKPDEALAYTLKLQQAFRQQNKPIIYIQHIKNDPSADFFAIGSKGANVHPALLRDMTSNEKVIIKHYPNSFLETTLQSELQKVGVEQLVICGMMTHMCIDSTTRQAAELGYKPILIADACATRDLSFGQQTVKAEQVQTAFLSALANFAHVIDSEQYIAENVH